MLSNIIINIFPIYMFKINKRFIRYMAIDHISNRNDRLKRGKYVRLCTSFHISVSVWNNYIRQIYQNHVGEWAQIWQSYVCIPDGPRLFSAVPSNPACICHTWGRPRLACIRIDQFPGCRYLTHCRVCCNCISSGNRRRPARERRSSRPGNSRATSPRISAPGGLGLEKHVT